MYSNSRRGSNGQGSSRRQGRNKSGGKGKTNPKQGTRLCKKRFRSSKQKCKPVDQEVDLRKPKPDHVYICQHRTNFAHCAGNQRFQQELQTHMNLIKGQVTDYTCRLFAAELKRKHKLKFVLRKRNGAWIKLSSEALEHYVKEQLMEYQKVKCARCFVPINKIDGELPEECIVEMTNRYTNIYCMDCAELQIGMKIPMAFDPKSKWSSTLPSSAILILELALKFNLNAMQLAALGEMDHTVREQLRMMYPRDENEKEEYDSKTEVFSDFVVWEEANREIGFGDCRFIDPIYARLKTKLGQDTRRGCLEERMKRKEMEETTMKKRTEQPVDPRIDEFLQPYREAVMNKTFSLRTHIKEWLPLWKEKSRQFKDNDDIERLFIEYFRMQRVVTIAPLFPNAVDVESSDEETDDDDDASETAAPLRPPKRKRSIPISPSPTKKSKAIAQPGGKEPLYGTASHGDLIGSDDEDDELEDDTAGPPKLKLKRKTTPVSPSPSPTKKPRAMIRQGDIQADDSHQEQDYDSDSETFQLVNGHMSDSLFRAVWRRYQEYDCRTEAYWVDLIGNYEATKNVLRDCRLLFGNNGTRDFEVINVLGDGHCGYYVLLMYLRAIGRIEEVVDVISFRKLLEEQIRPRFNCFTELASMTDYDPDGLCHSIYSDDWTGMSNVPNVDEGYWLDPTLLAAFCDYFDINVVVVNYMPTHRQHMFVTTWCRDATTEGPKRIAINPLKVDDPAENDRKNLEFIVENFNVEHNRFRKVDTLYMIHADDHFLWIRPKGDVRSSWVDAILGN